MMSPSDDMLTDIVDAFNTTSIYLDDNNIIRGSFNKLPDYLTFVQDRSLFLL